MGIILGLVRRKYNKPYLKRRKTPHDHVSPSVVLFMDTLYGHMFDWIFFSWPFHVSWTYHEFLELCFSMLQMM